MRNTRSKLTLIAFVLLILSLAFAVTAMAQDDDQDDDVTPESTAPATTENSVNSVFSQPDTIAVEIGVEEINTNLNQAYTLVLSSIDTIRQNLIDIGVAEDDIRLVDIELSPEDRLATGDFLYRATASLYVTADVELLEQITTLSVENGANIIRNLSLTGPRSPIDQEEPQRTITVSGTGRVFSQPDTIAVEIGVEEINTNLDQSYTLVMSSVDDIRQSLVDIGLAEDDIRLVDIVVLPEDRLDANSGPTGDFLYRVTASLYVTGDVNLLEQITTLSVENGANIIRNLSLTGPQNPMDQEEQARSLALENATQRATQIANATGLTLGQPLDIRETQVSIILSNNVPTSLEFITSQSDGVALITTVEVEITFDIED